MKKQLTELEGIIKQEISLRTPDEETIAEYAEAMKAGNIFPPVTIGTDSKKKTYFLVDGVHRVKAARVAGLTHLEAVEKIYDTDDAMLADMYMMNKHGAKVKPEDRDARITLLSDRYHWTQTKIAKEFGIDQSSVSRILSGDQKAGTATGAAKSRKEFVAMSAKAILKGMARMKKSLKVKSIAADLMSECWKAEGGTEKQNKERMQNLSMVKDFLEGIKALLNEVDKK